MSASLAILGREKTHEPVENANALRPGFKMMIALDKGAYIDVTDLNGTTQLTRSVEFGHMTMVKNLILAGANVNFVYNLLNEEIEDNGKKAKQKSYPLLKALKAGNHEMFRFLLDHGAKLIPKESEVKLSNGQVVHAEPFLEAVSQCRYDVRLLVFCYLLKIKSIFQARPNKQGQVGNSQGCHWSWSRCFGLR